MATANIASVRRSSGDQGRRGEGVEMDAVNVDDLLDIDTSPDFLFGRQFLLVGVLLLLSLMVVIDGRKRRRGQI